MNLIGLLTISLFIAYLAFSAKDRKRLVGILIAAFALRVTSAILFYYVWPDFGFQADAVWFDEQALEIARGGLPSVLESFATGSALYTWIVSVVYLIGGHDPFVPILINVVVGVFTVDLSWRIASRCTDDERVSTTVAWICALSPFSAFFSSIMYREPFVIVFLLIGILNAVEWSKNEKITSFAKAMAGFFVSGFFHTGSTVATLGFVGLLLISAFEGIRQGRSRRFIRSVGASLILFTVGYLVISYGFGLEKLSRGIDISEAQSIAARGRGAYLVDMVPSTSFDLLWQVPIRMFYFMFTPFPWQITSGADVLAFFEAFFMLFMSAKIVRNIGFVWRNPGLRTVFVMLLCLILVYSIGVSNYGTALRHREKFFALVVVVAFGASSLREKEPSRAIVGASTIQSA